MADQELQLGANPTSSRQTEDTSRSQWLPGVIACFVVAVLAALTPVVLILPHRPVFMGVSTTSAQFITKMAIFSTPLLAVFSMLLARIGLWPVRFVVRFTIVLMGIVCGLGIAALWAWCIGDTSAATTLLFVEQHSLVTFAKTLIAIAIPPMILQLATSFFRTVRDGERVSRFSIADTLAMVAGFALIFSIPHFGPLAFFGPWGRVVGIVGSVWLGISATLAWFACTKYEDGRYLWRRVVALLTLIIGHVLVWLALATLVIQPSSGSFQYAFGYAVRPAMIATIVLLVIQLTVGLAARRFGWSVSNAPATNDTDTFSAPRKRS